MAGNSFPTPDGGHVSGTVAMALDASGNAVPVDADTPIGTVNLKIHSNGMFYRALAAHAGIVTGKDPDECLATILAFARKDAP